MSRALAEKELLYFIDRFAPGSPNKAMYQRLMGEMSDTQFAEWCDKLASGAETLALYIPNLNEHKLSMERNFEIAEELDYDFFHHLHLTDPHTGQITRTEAKHLVLLLPFRRQAQMLYKKMSIPETNQSVDDRSGQATGASKGSRLSYPELQVNAAKGLDSAVLELIKFRGGDEKAYNAMNRSILETGEASLEAIAATTPSKVKASSTLATFLTSMHLKNNL
jgi:hypothetical protein